MNVLSIFAGLDRNDVLRFVGDVPRGAACGCHCAACGAPLVARRGEKNVWHFAHEASQERPDCLAGAVNLLRRLAIEQLRDTPALVLPTYRKVVSTHLPLPVLSETVELETNPVAIERWNMAPVRGGAAATLVLPDGSHALLFVEVRAVHAIALAVLPEMAALLVEIPLPEDGTVLQDLASATAYLESSRRIIWKNHPAGDALAASTLNHLQERAIAIENERTVLAGWTSHKTLVEREDHHGSRQDSGVSVATEADNPDWIAWRKPRSSFIFYFGLDGNGWLLLQHSDGGQVLVPWPILSEGWDEALPSTIGVPDHGLGGFRIVNEVRAMVYLGKISDGGVRTYSEWSDVPRQIRR